MPITRDRIAACTIAYPDLDLAVAARLQSETFRAVEVTFDYGISLPLREGVIADLAAVQRERRLDYAVHLPLSIQFASPNPLLRDASVRTVAETIDACAPLAVSAWVLHVTPFHSIERPITSRERAAAQRDIAVINATNSVRALLDRTGIPSRALAVENLGFPFAYIEPLLEACDTGICCDIGHLLAAGVDPAPFIERYAPRISHIHLHDVIEGRDHRGLGSGHGIIDLPPVWSALERVGYQGLVTLEVFTTEHIRSSLASVEPLLPEPTIVRY